MKPLIVMLIALGHEQAQKLLEFTFGTTVVSTSLLEGKIYFIQEIASGTPPMSPP